MLKHKPEIGKVNLENHYKSMGCVLKGKARPVVRIELSNPGSLLVSRGQLLHGGVTGRMQKIAGEHSKDITAVLQTLVRDGLLTQQNQRRWASYRVAEDSPQLAPDSPHKADSSPHLTQELLSLAEPARVKAKLPAAEMQALVLSLCEARWMSGKDLALLLSRDAENLQGRILTGLVKKGVLELRFPDVPNRPDQAYRTVSNPLSKT